MFSAHAANGPRTTAYGGSYAAAYATSRIHVQLPLLKKPLLASGLLRSILRWEGATRRFLPMKQPLSGAPDLVEVFDRISHAILSSIDLAGILRVFAEEIVASGAFRSMTIGLIDRRRGIVRIAEAITTTISKDRTPQRAEQVIGTEYPLEDSNVTAEVARTGSRVIIDGWDPRYDTSLAKPATMENKTAYFIPIKREDKVIAVMETASLTSERDKALSLLESMQPLLNHVAVAISHAELVLSLLESRQQLRHERDRIREYIDLAQTIFVVLDTEGSIEYVNTYGCECLGRSVAEMIGRDAFDLAVPLVDRKRLRARFHGLIRTGGAGPWVFEGSLQTARGELRRVLWHLAPTRDQTGAITGLVGSGEDQTEAQKLELQLRLAQKMEAIGTLAGGIAHDFNNILTVIMGHAELISGSSQLPEELKGSVDDIRQAGDRAAALVHKLLAFSQRQLLAIEQVDLNRAIRTAASLIRPIIRENVELDIQLNPDIPPIWADESQLEHVILNLAVNARDAMPEGGRFILRTDVEHVEYDPRRPWMPAGDYVTLTASDSGIGIDEDVLPHVFEPFFSTKPVGAGSGLGLAMVYGIIKQSHGYIDVESEVGVGAVFTLFFPFGTMWRASR